MEKSLARMVKAKAKAEHAAAQQATHASLAAAMHIVDSPAPTPKASSSTVAAAPADDSASGEMAVTEPGEGAASAPRMPSGCCAPSLRWWAGSWS
jgi:E3 ubiquitin-protein ligase TRIP12